MLTGLGQIICFFMPHAFAYSILFAKNVFCGESTFYFKVQVECYCTSQAVRSLP